MARVLAIDYGKKRSGIAVTDHLQIIASGTWEEMFANFLPYPVLP